LSVTALVKEVCARDSAEERRGAPDEWRGHNVL